MVGVYVVNGGCRCQFIRLVKYFVNKFVVFVNGNRLHISPFLSEKTCNLGDEGICLIVCESCFGKGNLYLENIMFPIMLSISASNLSS